MLRKLRKDALGSRLTDSQRELLDTWLFEDNIGYKGAMARAQAEWGINLCLGSLCRYRQRRAKLSKKFRYCEVCNFHWIGG